MCQNSRREKKGTLEDFTDVVKVTRRSDIMGTDTEFSLDCIGKRGNNVVQARATPRDITDDSQAA